MSESSENKYILHSGAIPAFDKELATALCDLEVPRRIKISPNGQKVLYNTSTVPVKGKGKDKVSTLWIASASDADSSRQFTSGRFNDQQPAWHPNGDQIAFVSNRLDAKHSSCIYMMRLDGGDAITITPKDNLQDIKSFAFSPDGKYIAYTSLDEKTKEQKEKDEKGEADPNVWSENWKFARLRVLDISTSAVRTLVEDARTVLSFAWSHDSKDIVFDSKKTSDIDDYSTTISTVSAGEGGDGVIKDLYTVKNMIYHLSWPAAAATADGKIYYITGYPEESGLGSMAVYAIDPTAAADSTTAAAIRVACGEDDTAEALVVTGSKLLVHRAVRVGSKISDVNGGSDYFSKTEGLDDWDAHYNEETKSLTFAVSLSSTSSPAEVFIVKDGDGHEDIKLSNHGKIFTDRQFGSCTVITCQSSDAEEELDGLYMTPTAKAGPDGTPKEAIPTIVMIHGGPSTRNQQGFDANGHYSLPYILSLGYGVLIPQYRGSTGRGSKFASYSVGGQGKYDYQDVISITDNAIKKGFADSTKVMAYGWSQGGLLNYICSVRNGLHGLGWRFNATIAGAGICDIEGMALTSDIGVSYQGELNNFMYPWVLKKDDTRGRQGSALWEVADAVAESRRTGKPVIPPMLILHGENDQRCPFSQAKGFHRALSHYGLPCEFVAYPGQGHSLTAYRFWLDRLERIGRWAHTYIGPSSV